MGTANTKEAKTRKGKSNPCKHEECKASKQSALSIESLEKKKAPCKPSYIDELIKKRNLVDSIPSISYKTDLYNSEEDVKTFQPPVPPKPNKELIVYRTEISTDDLIARDILPELPKVVSDESLTSKSTEKSEVNEFPSTAVEFSGSKRTPPESNKSSTTTVDKEKIVNKKKNEEIYEQMEALGLGFLRNGEWIPTDVISRTIWKKVETENAGCDAKWKRQSKTFPCNVYK